MFFAGYRIIDVVPDNFKGNPVPIEVTGANPPTYHHGHITFRVVPGGFYVKRDDGTAPTKEDHDIAMEDLDFILDPVVGVIN
jgi:hypothetical protein